MCASNDGSFVTRDGRRMNPPHGMDQIDRRRRPSTLYGFAHHADTTKTHLLLSEHVEERIERHMTIRPNEEEGPSALLYHPHQDKKPSPQEKGSPPVNIPPRMPLKSPSRRMVPPQARSVHAAARTCEASSLPHLEGEIKCFQETLDSEHSNTTAAIAAQHEQMEHYHDTLCEHRQKGESSSSGTRTTEFSSLQRLEDEILQFMKSFDQAHSSTAIAAQHEQMEHYHNNNRREGGGESSCYPETEEVMMALHCQTDDVILDPDKIAPHPTRLQRFVQEQEEELARIQARQQQLQKSPTDSKNVVVQLSSSHETQVRPEEQPRHVYPTGPRVKILNKEHALRAMKRGEATLFCCAGCRRSLLASQDTKVLYCSECGTLTPTHLDGVALDAEDRHLRDEDGGW